MRKLYIIANWKSYKTILEAKSWLEEFSTLTQTTDSEQASQVSEDREKIVIVCPPFTLLPLVHKYVTKNNLNIKIGAQDASPFDEGAYTGEVNAKQIREFATYCIIGHSERRRFLRETDALLAKKVAFVQKYDITPIYCIQSNQESVPTGVTIVAYEPTNAIGRGAPDTPESAVALAKSIKMKFPFVTDVLYGGSVAPDNVSQFSHQQELQGVLVGGASLDSQKFSQIIANV